MLTFVFLLGSLALAAPAAPAAASNHAGGSGQRLWQPLPALDQARGALAPSMGLARYRALELDRYGMRALLATAPHESTSSAVRQPLILALPTPTGRFARFAVQESPVVAHRLQVRFPFVRTYSGQGIDDPAATIRFDLGRTGFHAQVLSPDGNWYIDPYYHLDQSVYVSYFKHDLVDSDGPFRELPPIAADGVSDALADAGSAERVVGSQLRTYRLAVAADGEYSTFQGGTVPLVHNAIVTAINRVTGVYERELAIRLQLVANNDSLIYL